MKYFLLIICIILTSICAVFAQDAEVVVNEESGTAYKEGLKYYSEGKYDDSIRYFQKAYELDDRNISALFAHGLALNKQGKYKGAAEKFGLTLDKDPGHTKALRLYPSTLARIDEDEKAINAYDKSIATTPDDYYLYWGKARVLIKLQKYDEAISQLKKSIEIDPKQETVYETLAFVYRQQKNIEDALSAYEKALELKPGDIKYMYYRAQTLSELGRMEDAYKAAIEILGKNQNHARARVIVADYKRLKGQYQEALDDYNIAAKNIETKAYAEHFIGVINQKLEEIEIEKEWETRQKQQQNSNQ
ncbi:MAG: tetratricopeptide repeat protein [Candidatus Latescibacteria bacterium]|nr:tetratricopeptide repeat protein [Candidatus Latescibacterota bacterium]